MSPSNQFDFAKETLKRISALHLDSASCDLTLEVPDGQQTRTFPCHRFLLSLWSKPFKAMLEGEYREKGAKNVTLKDLSAQGVALLLQMIYRGDVNIASLEAAAAALEVGERFSVEILKRLAVDKLESLINAKTCGRILELGLLYSLDDLTLRAREFILLNPKPSSLSGFTDLSKSAVKELALREDWVASEFEVFQAMKKWWECKVSRGESSKECAFCFVPFIRFNSMKLAELKTILKEGKAESDGGSTDEEWDKTRSLSPPRLRVPSRIILEAILSQTNCQDVSEDLVGSLKDSRESPFLESLETAYFNQKSRLQAQRKASCFWDFRSCYKIEFDGNTARSKIVDSDKASEAWLRMASTRNTSGTLRWGFRINRMTHRVLMGLRVKGAGPNEGFYYDAWCGGIQGQPVVWGQHPSIPVVRPTEGSIVKFELRHCNGNRSLRMDINGWGFVDLCVFIDDKCYTPYLLLDGTGDSVTLLREFTSIDPAC